MSAVRINREVLERAIRRMVTEAIPGIKVTAVSVGNLGDNLAPQAETADGFPGADISRPGEEVTEGIVILIVVNPLAGDGVDTAP